MKGRIAQILVLLMLAVALDIGSSPTRVVAQDAPTAVLTSCKGSVTVVAGHGQPVTATFGMALNDGDEVRTGAGAEAEIMFSTGNWVQVGANSSMRIKGRPGADPGLNAKAEGGAAPSSKGDIEVVQNFLKLKNSEGTSSVSGLRSAEKASALVPISPCQTRVRDARPTFRWQIDDPSTELQLTVYNESGVQWQHKVSGATSFAYPADAPELKPGVSYSWTLETTDPMVSPPLRTSAVFFEVLAKDQAESLERDLAGIDAKKPGAVSYRLMRASMFFDRGLVDDAIGETQAALAADPGNDSLHMILGRLYAETGRTKDAVDEMSKARQ
jgi:Tetratricopeptide repeat